MFFYIILAFKNASFYHMNKVLPSFLSGVVLSCSIVTIPIFADKLPQPALSGFASFVYAQTLTDDRKETPFEGMTNEGEWSYFNKVGLRLDGDLKQQLNYTIQVTANGEDEYQPKLDWAFAKYSITDNLSLHIGKMRLPLYMYSEYKDVSYAYQWVIPPYAVYGSPDFANFDGLALNYLYNLAGEWTAEAQIWVGSTKDSLELGGIGGEPVDIDMKDLLGAQMTLDRDWLSIRAVYMQGQINLTLPPELIPQLGHQFSAVNLAQAKSIAWEDDRAQFFGLGIRWDNDFLFVNSELTHIQTEPNAVLGHSTSFYLMGGIRTSAEWTFSLTYAYDKDQSDKKSRRALRHDIDRLLVGYDAEITAEARALNIPIDTYRDLVATDLFNGINSQIYEQNKTFRGDSYILTTRWDFHPSASAKLEYIIKEKTQYGVHSTPQGVRTGINFIF